MATDDDNKKDDDETEVEPKGDDEVGTEVETQGDDEAVDALFVPPEGGEPVAVAPAGDDDDEEPESERGAQPTQLGATKYVHAAFFAAGIGVAYLSGKMLEMIWNALATWPAAVRAVPQLLRYAEDDRGTITMIAGAVIGVLGVIQTYRRDRIRRWAGEVAIELSKCKWPDRQMVTSGTIVVVIASAIATLYVALLDRLWGFLTTLVYGA
jgi:preprotein translocase subunit SecE